MSIVFSCHGFGAVDNGVYKCRTILHTDPGISFPEADRICGVMVSVLTSSAVDRWFEPRSGQTKDYEISICCFSAKHAALRRKSKN
jgi:hypothetical protein